MELDKNVDNEHNDEESNDDDDENNKEESGDEDGDNNGDDENKSVEDEDNDDDNFTVHECTNPCEPLVPLSTLLLDIFHLFFTSSLLLLICD